MKSDTKHLHLHLYFTASVTSYITDLVSEEIPYASISEEEKNNSKVQKRKDKINMKK